MSEGAIQLAAAASRVVSRNFQESWKKFNPWLRFSEDTKRMSSVCCGETPHTGSNTLKKSHVMVLAIRAKSPTLPNSFEFVRAILLSAGKCPYSGEDLRSQRPAKL
jgi:hypothetical protein